MFLSIAAQFVPIYFGLFPGSVYFGHINCDKVSLLFSSFWSRMLDSGSVYTTKLDNLSIFLSY